MRQLALLVLTVTLLSSCKKKCDNCGPHQQCVNGICECQEWYEGPNCDTAMIEKYNGTYIGMSYVNSANPITDTFIFQSSLQPNVSNLINSDHLPGRKQDAAISLTHTTTADYLQFIGLPNQTLEIQKKCGSVVITPNGQSIVLNYYWINGGGHVDSNTLFTFIGTKQ